MNLVVNRSAEIDSAAIQMQALRAARAAGIAVPKKALEAAMKYLDEKIDLTTSEPIIALAGAVGAAEYESALAKKWLGVYRARHYFINPNRKRREPEPEMILSLTVLAYLLGDDGHGKLLPETKPEDRLSWARFRKGNFDNLMRFQRDDGHWDDDSGAVRPTAVYLIMLQLDNAALPIYQR